MRIIRGVFLSLMLAMLLVGCTEYGQAASKDPAKKETQEKQEAQGKKEKKIVVEQAMTEQAKLKQLGPAPDFTILDSRQDEVTLSDYKGKNAVLLFFWTTWCPFCQREIKSLSDRYASLVKDGLEVFGVNVGERSEVVERFVNSNFLSFRVLLDQDTVVATKYALLGVPTYVLIDKEGSIIFQDNYFPQSEYKQVLSQ